jgi:hypothetical protein
VHSLFDQKLCISQSHVFVKKFGYQSRIGEKNRYDITMNSMKVRIENNFGTLKNRWWIFKAL